MKSGVTYCFKIPEQIVDFRPLEFDSSWQREYCERMCVMWTWDKRKKLSWIHFFVNPSYSNMSVVWKILSASDEHVIPVLVMAFALGKKSSHLTHQEPKKGKKKHHWVGYLCRMILTMMQMAGKKQPPPWPFNKITFIHMLHFCLWETVWMSFYASGTVVFIVLNLSLL